MLTHEVLEKYQRGERDFSGAHITGADFSSMSLKGINFKKAILVSANFNGTDLTEANFEGADLQMALFEKAILNKANFTNSNLFQAKMTGAFFDQTTLKRANLTGTHLCKSDLARCDLSDATLSFACIVDSNITMDQMAGIPGEVIKTMSTVEKKEQQPGWGGIYQTGKQSDFGTYGTPLEGPEGKEHSPQRDNYGTQTGSGDQAFYLSGAVMQQSTMASQPKKFMRKAMK